MQAAKNLSPAEDTKARTDLRAAGWIPINAKFANKCAVCGSSAPVGSMIAWNKTTSKIMHYNPCALEFLEKGGAATTTPNFPPPPQVSVGLGGKKAAKPAAVPAAPFVVPTPPTIATPTPAPAVTATTTKETTKAPVATKETKNEPAAKPQQRKFSFTNIKLSDLKR